MSFTGYHKGEERTFKPDCLGRSQVLLYIASALEHDPSFKGCIFHSY